MYIYIYIYIYRERERERQTDRQTDKQTDRQTDRQTERVFYVFLWRVGSWVIFLRREEERKDNAANPCP